MNNRTLTSANSVIMLSVTSVFPVPVRIQGYSADDVTELADTQPKETAMGVDGRLSAGFVPVPVTQNISLQADSQSNDFFEAWALYERNTRETLVATGTIVLPAVNRTYILTRGFLQNFSPMAAARRTLQPRRFSIVWESCLPSPMI